MKTVALVIPIVFAAAVARAQENATPVVETGMNFSFTNLYPGSGFPSFTSVGGTGTVEYNVNRMLGVVADLGGYRNNGDVNFNPTTFTYLFGPRVNFRRSRITPYAQALFGGARVSTSLTDPVTGNAFSENGFAMAYGGGMDVRLTNHVYVKPFQVEYLMTQTPNIWSPDGNQNSLRFSAGVVFRFGSK
jgi:opacity protein-like surface antigen